MGLSFETAAKALKRLYEQEPEFANPASERRFMLWWDKQERSLQQFVNGGTEALENQLIFELVGGRKALEALRFLGKPFEVLTQIKKRIFAA